MKTIKILGLTTFFIVSVFSLVACNGQGNAVVKESVAKTNGKGFAVLELFTSEGCSSCPPADALLAKIQEEAKDQQVYILAYHVDYWDRLGWKDVFSNADYSKRQIQYGNWLSAQVYTPQLVVNGKTELIGSDEAAVRKAITQQLMANAGATLAIHVHQERDNLKVAYETSTTKEGNNLLLALVEKTAQSQVKRGENAGRFLSHVQIVSKLQSYPLDHTGKGTASLALPKNFNNENWEILALIQDNESGEILSAAKTDSNIKAFTTKN